MNGPMGSAPSVNGRDATRRDHRRHTASARQERPLERAQLVWERAHTQPIPSNGHDRFAVALDLMRMAHHDPSTLSHALAIGRNARSRAVGDVSVDAAVQLLERAVAFVGVKPEVDGAGGRSR
jgi:hypothetical protein